MSYSTNPDKSTVPIKVRHKILNLKAGEEITLHLQTEALAKNTYQAIRAFLLGHDKNVPKAECIAPLITTRRTCSILKISRRDCGIIGME